MPKLATSACYRIVINREHNSLIAVELTLQYISEFQQSEDDGVIEAQLSHASGGSQKSNLRRSAKFQWEFASRAQLKSAVS